MSHQVAAALKCLTTGTRAAKHKQRSAVSGCQQKQRTCPTGETLPAGKALQLLLLGCLPLHPPADDCKTHNTQHIEKVLHPVCAAHAGFANEPACQLTCCNLICIHPVQLIQQSQDLHGTEGGQHVAVVAGAGTKPTVLLMVTRQNLRNPTDSSSSSSSSSACRDWASHPYLAIAARLM
jgi:hypothetical protein